MPGDPEAIEWTRRLELAYEIPERIQCHYEDTVLAIGLYGSLARGSDGPYSDIEMHCMARVADAAETFWSGVEMWANERGITIEEKLETLLVQCKE